MSIKNKKAERKVKTVDRKAIEFLRVDNKIHFINLIVNLLIPLLGAIITIYFNINSISIYEDLKKPFLSPSPLITLIIWTSLYIILGIAAYRFYTKNENKKLNSNGYFFYLLQLFCYFGWKFLFITFRLYGLSFILLIVIVIISIITSLKFFRIDKKSAFLILPYIMWLIYSAVINYFIWFYNEM
ncbi:TspO/MBR family protein [Clostridium isatidis]|uniref:TspO/MBR family protein n=1 Tax=Clostridium isatidis TaxID=182773 RepID=UPI003AADE00F